MNTVRNAERPLYVLAAIGVLAIVFAGFAHTFYLKFAFGTPELSGLLHLHGLLMTAWILLFLVQTTLIAKQRTDLHRQLGVFGTLLAIAIVIVNLTTAITAGRLGHAPPAVPVPPLAFMAIPLFDVPVFATLVAAGVWFRRRSDMHKRLMLLASLSILTPGIARLPLHFFQSGTIVMYFGTTILAVLACVAWDTARNRRLHPAFMWGGLLIVLSWPLRLALSGTAAWMQFATWLTQ